MRIMMYDGLASRVKILGGCEHSPLAKRVAKAERKTRSRYASPVNMLYNDVNE
jgi:hypothetical protein